jgi:hypothetical protein
MNVGVTPSLDPIAFHRFGFALCDADAIVVRQRLTCEGGGCAHLARTSCSVLTSTPLQK